MDYAVKIGIRNGRILRRMSECGIESQSELARLAGLTQTAVNSIVTLRRAPRGVRGEWTYGIREIAAVLRCEPEDLFSERQQTMALDSNSTEVFMAEERVEALMGGDPEESSWAKLEAQRLIQTLTDREQSVVDGVMHGATLEEIGIEHGVTRERVRQIYLKALRRMRSVAARGEKDTARLLCGF